MARNELKIMKTDSEHGKKCRVLPWDKKQAKKNNFIDDGAEPDKESEIFTKKENGEKTSIENWYLLNVADATEN